ncbi:MAG: hypothetical protein HYX86_03780 [Chloroflexi bacterium]|nr:hypothetical protein [Chloroflexota bacterium]
MKIRIPRALLIDPGSAGMALLLGITVWVVAAVEQASFVTTSFPLPIPLQVRNLESDLVLVDPLPEAVQIVIRAPQRVLAGLGEADFEAYLDLQGRGVGSYRVRVRVDSRIGLVRVVEVSPPEITVALDRRGEKQITVEVKVEWDEPPGFALGEPVVTPPVVVITGPQSLVEKVLQVVAEVSLAGERSTVEGEYPLIALDGEGNAINNLEFNPAAVRVQVPIEARLGYREVAVKPLISGPVPSGYWVSSLQVSPATVTVFGDPLVVERLPGFIETEPLDVEGVTGELEINIGLLLPSGLEILGSRTVLLSIEISPVLGGQTVQVTPTLFGLGEGLEAEFSPDTVEVIISGPLPELQALGPGDVQVILDLSRLGPGTYRLTPRVEVPETLQVQSVVPSQLEVILTSSE